ncbi:FG-GAP repeat protein [Candidatus Uhrbacteria bacterium]|nr:FG-GAP repeat protein [Candidatus Uhrbacteria bacterium]
MMRFVKTIVLACSLFATVSCDKLSPFISDEQFNERIDLDDDGVPNEDDCDPNDSSIAKLTYYRDLDEDGYGSQETQLDCEKIKGFVEKPGDCDDSDENINPNAIEICNLIDDNCDNNTDEGLASRWYHDKDEDGHGDLNEFLDACDQPDEFVAIGDDCNDGDQAINPGAIEVCDDRVDQDCNGILDDAIEAKLWFSDKDGDGFGDPFNFILSCKTHTGGYSPTDDDCDDENANISPKSPEMCKDEVDNDCDGITDTDFVDMKWYRDADKDGYGTSDDSKIACSSPAGYVGNYKDCDDESEEINPSVEETCNNGVDDNCDEDVNECKLSGTISLNTANASIYGESEGDIASKSIAAIGDVNGDWFEDILIGSPGNDEAGQNAGSAYIVFGPITSGMINLKDAKVRFLGEAENDSAGSVVASAGDANGDFIPDILISAPMHDGEKQNIGAVYLLYGPFDEGIVSLSDADVKYLGTTENGNAGASIAGGKDVNKDGLDDIIIGVPFDKSDQTQSSAIHFLLSPFESTPIVKTILMGQDMEDQAGASVTFADDRNGDEVPEIVIGATFCDDGPNRIDVGCVYIVSGTEATIEGIRAIPSSAIRITGENSGDNAGKAIQTVGDVDGDSIRELIVGVQNNARGGVGAGSVYVLFSASPTPLILTLADIILFGNATSWTGYSVADAGDVNDDGINDWLIGAPQCDAEFENGGCTYIVIAKKTNSIGSITNENTATITGINIDNLSGTSLLGGIDWNNDSIIDIIIGSKQNTPYIDVGAAFLIEGLGF